jgi:hypothetical protein
MGEILPTSFRPTAMASKKPHKSIWAKGSSFIVSHFKHLFKAPAADSSSLKISQTKVDAEFNKALAAFEAKMDRNEASDVKQLVHEFVNLADFMNYSMLGCDY